MKSKRRCKPTIFMTEDFKRVHFVHRPDHGLTVGYVMEQMEDRIRVKSAYSIVSQRDHFNRAIGRAVVTGRLNCTRANKGFPHHTEFFLSGKLPTTGDQWRQFEAAVIAQTGEFYDAKLQARKLEPYAEDVQAMMESASSMAVSCTNDDGN